MKKLILLFVVLVFTSFIWADWEEGDGHKMHFPQLPDPSGYDIDFTYDPDVPNILADDWTCTESGPVSDIHFWISFQGQLEPTPAFDILTYIEFIHVSIHSDTLDPAQGWSKPDDLLWSMDFYPQEIPGQVTVVGPIDGTQGWADPWIGESEYPDHNFFYQVNINFIPQAFYQYINEVYWLDLSIKLTVNSPYQFVGWKTSQTAVPYPYLDTAVYLWTPPDGWLPLPGSLYNLNPPYNEAVDFAFVITGEEALPLELSAFTALYSDGTPELHWTTLSELNNLGWNVYRSETELGDQLQINSEMIEGAGTSTTPTNYTFIDETPTQENNTYWYWLESVSSDNQSVFHGPISLLVPEEGYEPGVPTIPEIYGLYDNYPNPFNPGTVISFNVPENTSAELVIYNVKGAKICTLFKGNVLGDNEYIFEWDGKDAQGKEVESGIYLYVLQTDSKTYSKKMVLTK